MAVTLLPANTLSAAYAEELDAIEAEVSDSIVGCSKSRKERPFRCKDSSAGRKGKTAEAAYTGNAVTPYKADIKIKGLEDITIILDGNGADYESKGFKVTYANNTLKGKATIVIEATSGNTSFVGSDTAVFSIVRKN